MGKKVSNRPADKELDDYMNMRFYMVMCYMLGWAQREASDLPNQN